MPHRCGGGEPAAPAGVRRRGLLAAFGAGAVALTLGACTPKAGQATDPTSHAVATDPLGPLYTETLALVSTYDAAITANPGMTTLLGTFREDHRQHAIALAALLRIPAPAINPQPSTSPSSLSAGSGPGAAAATGTPTASAPASQPSTATDKAALAPLADRETAARDNAVNACLAAPADRAAVLASIAASRACHLVVLS